jgi:hypothetical protein
MEIGGVNKVSSRDYHVMWTGPGPLHSRPVERMIPYASSQKDAQESHLDLGNGDWHSLRFLPVL